MNRNGHPNLARTYIAPNPMHEPESKPAMTETHDRHGYPLQGFFVAHRRFMTLPGQPWGDILDGPQVDDEAVIEAIIEAWKEYAHAPDFDDLRVWHIVPGKPAEDCTAWAVRTVTETLEERA